MAARAARTRRKAPDTEREPSMSSILTNTSAMTALQNLQSINSRLAETQEQISTGKSVANANDNATV
ncbi:flagellin N-terminal helical domain-containing protein [Tranquillimonas alkanivorans]|uniref:flagellin N-terminal helical domain-containing protein n=1 Tax=Tranquillimonas alkanivorans TaxID=441119 RepID=UPI0034E0D5B5